MTKDGFTYAIETLPWQECARLIQSCNARNRPITERRVETIARSMKQDRFLTIHQGIAFDPSGQVIDGQHRLMGAARAKVDLRILVCRYTDARLADEAMAIFDSGRQRSTSDGLAIGGVLPKEEAAASTATINAMVSAISLSNDGKATGRGARLDVQETAEFYRANREAVRWAIAHAPRRSGAQVRAAFAIAYKVNPPKVSEFAAQINEGACAPGTAAALWNRAVADGLLAATGRSVERIHVAWRALRIIRAHVTGERAPSRLFTNDEALKWFLAEKSVLPPPTDEPMPPSEAQGKTQRTLDVLGAGGASVADASRLMNEPYRTTAKRLRRMADIGLVEKTKPGFYVPAKVAA